MHVLATGLTGCYDQSGLALECGAPEAMGQDAALQRGKPWPEPRFQVQEPGLVRDLLTDLLWTQDATPFSFPCTWAEALQQVAEFNASGHLGRDDWRLPNRRELRSLICHGARRPALPPGHPFSNVFQSWYWSSTSSARAPAYAWYVHLAGGRMFYGAKTGDCLVWPVCGQSRVLPRTGQRRCFDQRGAELPCASPQARGQDAALLCGVPWPDPRFELLERGQGQCVLDRLTGIVWRRHTSREGLLTWQQALDTAARLADADGLPWRLPNINELESLADASRHAPALPEGHPFLEPQQAYWSSTTSFFEPDWSYCFYLDKGAVGVGHKPAPEFWAWFAMDEGT